MSRGQQFPNANEPIAQGDGKITRPWFSVLNSLWRNANGGTVTGSGTAGRLAKWLTTSSLTDALAAASSKLLGSGASGSGAPYGEITLGTNLSMSGTTLNAASGGGTVTTTGSPSSGNLTKFSGATTITNAELTGDVTTAGGVATTIASNAVTTSKIANAAVTLAKIQNAAASSQLLGSGSAGSGSPYRELSIDNTLAISGTTLSVVTGGGGGVGNVLLFDRKVNQSVGNTTTETALYSVSIPGGTLGAKTWRTRISGTFLNNSGSTDTVTWRLKYGATTLYGTGGGWSSSSATCALLIDIEFGNAGATNSQWATLTLGMGTASAPTVAGFSVLDANARVLGVGAGSAAEDSTTTLTWQLTVQHNVAHAQAVVTGTLCTTELIG